MILHWCWQTGWYGRHRRRISADNRNDLITVDFETGMKANNNVVREHTLRFLSMNKNIPIISLLIHSITIWHSEVTLCSICSPVWCHILSTATPIDSSIRLCPTPDTHYFDRSQRRPNQRMVHWISSQSVRTINKRKILKTVDFKKISHNIPSHRIFNCSSSGIGRWWAPRQPQNRISSIFLRV